jgi:hypothetical protein
MPYIGEDVSVVLVIVIVLNRGRRYKLKHC